MNENHPTEIANRFQVTSTLGEGGMGYVYKAHDPILNKTVAIKILRDGLPPQSIIRFQQEAKAVAKLNHPNVINVFDFDIADDIPYLVMEYLEGQALSEYLKSNEWNESNLEEVLELFIQIAEGLSHAHAHGILHRDIKPSNAMLIEADDGTSQVKLVDFGLAKLEDDQKITSTGATLGSPLYMSPEQVSAHELTEASDVYSFGCIMYETICGYPPFQAKSAAKTMVMHKIEPVPPVEKEFHGIEVPAQLERLIKACLQKSPETRPTLDSIKRILSELLEELTTIPIAPEEEEQSWVVPFRLSSITKDSQTGRILIGLLAVGIIGGFFFIKSKNQTPADKVLTGTALERSDKVPQNVYTDERYKEEEKKFKGSELSSDALLRKQLSSSDAYFENLDFQNSQIEGTFFDLLVDKPIENLNLNGCRNLKNESIETLSKNKRLKMLDLSRCSSLTNEGYRHLPKMTGLLSLVLKSENVNNETMEIVSKIPNLIWLRVEAPSKVNDQGFSHIASHKKGLALLQFHGTEITSKSFAKLKSFPILNVLSLEAVNLKDEDIPYLCLRPVFSINISSNGMLTPRGFNQLHRQKKLNSIYVRRTNFDDTNVPLLLALKPQAIDIGFTKITRKGLEKIATMKGVTTLDISGLGLYDQSIECLAKMKELESLNLGMNNLTNDAIDTLIKMKSLKRVQFNEVKKISSEEKNKDNIGITRVGVEKFLDNMPHCKTQ